MSRRILLIDPLKCSGCRRCQLACSFAKDKVFSYAASRVRLQRLADMASTFPVVCQQCETPMCTFACPTGAISQDKQTGIVSIRRELCIGCLMCFFACPLGGISVLFESRIPIKCDLCNGEPQCALECEYGAIEFVTLDQANAIKTKKGVKELPRLLELVSGSG